MWRVEYKYNGRNGRREGGLRLSQFIFLIHYHRMGLKCLSKEGYSLVDEFFAVDGRPSWHANVVVFCGLPESTTTTYGTYFGATSELRLFWQSQTFPQGFPHNLNSCSPCGSPITVVGFDKYRSWQHTNLSFTKLLEEGMVVDVIFPTK